MPNWWDEDAPDEGGGEGNWWEEDATPKKLTGVASAWTPSTSAKKKVRSPLSLSEKIQQQSTGFLSGLAQEAPNVLQRFANLGSDIGQGWKEIARDKGLLGSSKEDINAQLLDAEKKWKARQEFERSSAPAPNENLGMSIGRLGAKAAPQIALGIASGGASVPVQAGLGGGLEMLQSLSEGDTPGQAGFRTALAGSAPFAARGTNALFSKIKAPFAGKVDQSVIDAAARLRAGGTNVDLPASAITNSSLARGLEQMGSKMIGGGAIESRGLQALDEIGAKAGQLGAGADPMVAGRGVAAGEDATRRMLQGRSAAEYGKLGDPNAFQVPEGFTVAQLDEWIKQGTMAPDQLQTLKNLRKAISPVEQTGEDVSGPALQLLAGASEDNRPAMIEAMRKAGFDPEAVVGGGGPRSVADLTSQKAGIRYGGPNATGEAAIDNRLRDLLSQDIDAALLAAKPEEAAQLKVAQGAHKQFRDFTDSELAGTVAAHKPQGQYDKITEAVLNPKASAVDIQRLLDSTDAKTQRHLGEVLIQKIVGNAENLTPKKIQKGLYDYRNVASKLLTPDQIQQLRDLSAVRMAMGKTVIGSPTTPLLQSRKYIEAIPNLLRLVATGGGGAVGQVAGAAGGLAAETAGETLLTKFLASAKGQKWLTTGLGAATRPGMAVGGATLGLAKGVGQKNDEARRRRELDALIAGR